ncbi:MAG TPA: zinc ribbon domain-containing protein [Candidatus Limnocylindrales bacterium]|nr:zinc ribbon domain-containing protein [Candidatus Limnocylindrales bacterium]
MDELLEIVGEQVAAVISHPVVVFAIQATVAYLCILWLACAFWVFRDLYRRTRDPISPYAAAGAVVLFTPLFFPLALLAYRLMRPATTLVERRAMELEAELLAREADVEACPACGRRVQETWSRCPACGVPLASDCPGCGERVGLDWVVCAWCAYDFEDWPTQPVSVLAAARPHTAPATAAPAAPAALAAGPLASLPSARPR